MASIEQRIMQMNENEVFTRRLKNMVVGRLRAEHATDLSDDELTRCLGNCVSSTLLVETAKQFRDAGYITPEEIAADERASEAINAALESRIEAMGRALFDPDLKQKIVCTLVAQGAKDLSDAEIDRCLSDCAAGWVPRVAKMFRDCEFLFEHELVP